MAIITISRQVGSLGDEIAKAVAHKLGCGCIGKTQISESLSDKGFAASDIEKYDEKKPSIWQSISIQKKKFSHLIRAAVYEVAAQENVVIVGQGGQTILKNFPGILHVRVMAPSATRVKRLMAKMQCDEHEAGRIISQLDHDRSGYVSAYFDADWDDKDLYDLVINTRTMSLDACVAIITCALEADEFKKSPQVDQKFSELALIQQVEAALVKIPGLEVSDIGVENGIVNLSGSVKSSEAKDECENAVLNIEGVTGVNNQLTVTVKKRPRML
jgi:cytidylate kinase